MSEIKRMLDQRTALIELMIEFAKDINDKDIDFGELAVDEENLYKTLALTLADNPNIDDPIIARATILALTVENFVLNAKLFGKIK